MTNPQIPASCSSNDFLNVFNDKIIGIIDKISMSTSVSGSFIANTRPSTCTEQLKCLTPIPQSEQLVKLVVTSKYSTSLLDPIPTKLLNQFFTLLILNCHQVMSLYHFRWQKLSHYSRSQIWMPLSEPIIDLFQTFFIKDP